MSQPDNVSQAPESPSAKIAKAQRRQGRWFVRLLLSVAALSGVAWFLPEMVARTALRQEVPKLLFPFFKGHVVLGETSLGWMSPVVVRDVRVTDPEGAPLLTIGEVRSSATLWWIATDQNSLGRLDLRELAATVLTGPKGTNFDQTLADFQSAPSPAKQKSLELVCEAAQIDVTDEFSGETVTLPPIDVSFRVGMTEPDAVEVEVTARDREYATSSLHMRTVTPLRTASAKSMEWTVTAEHWQLAQLTPLLRQWSTAGRVFGVLDGTATVSVSTESPSRWSCDSNLQIDQLEMLGWPQLHGDDFRLERLGLNGQVSANNNLIQCRQLHLNSRAAELKADGTWSLPNWQQMSRDIGTPLLSLVDEDFQLAGWLDGAELARQLPRTLPLREGTTIASARVQWELGSQQSETGRVWVGRLGLNELAAETNGAPWKWDSPIAAELRLKREAEGLTCEQLVVTSEFLRVQGTGTPARANLQAVADLDRLNRKLSDLLDSQQYQMSGLLRLNAQIATDADDRVKLNTVADIERLVLGNPQQPLWSEPKLQATISAIGSGPTEAPWRRLDSGHLELVAGNDRLLVDLVGAVEWPSTSSKVPLQCELAGDLARWQHRLKPILQNDVGDLQGQVQLVAAASWSQAELTLDKLTLAARPVRWTTPGWHIDEPELQVQTQGTWSSQAQRFTSPMTTVLASFGRVECEHGALDLAQSATVPLTGDVRFEADVGRISRWQTGDVQHHLLGTVKGVVSCQANDEAIGISVNADGTGLTLAGLTSTSAAPGVPAGAHWVALWKEPQLHLQTQVRFTPANETWDLQHVEIAGDGLAIDATAQTRLSGKRLQFTTQGQLDYDWSRLSNRMDPEFSRKIQLTGAGKKPFALKGQWQLGDNVGLQDLAANAGNPLTGEFGIGWDSARLLGLAIGPAEITGRFTGDSGTIQPLDLAIAEGQVHLAPQFRFQPGPTLVALPAGRILDRVRLSPELCRDSLKYVTPMLADATQVDGRFSLDVTEAVWPVGNSGAGTCAGGLTIHGAQVRPGPLVVQLMTTVEQIRSVVQRRAPRDQSAERVLLELPEQTVQFRQADQRVAHDRFIMRIRDVEIQTRGSVGMDESLNLVAAIPIREDWISDERIRQALGGQMLQVPIYGTLQQPQIDPRAIAELARRAAGGAIERVIEGRLKDQLDRLFPR